MTDLKPCPFCGGEADVMLSQSRWGQSYTIHHNEKGVCPAAYVASMQFATEAEAIAAWNARAERTCRMEYQTEGMQRGWWKCSECGEAMDTIEACAGRKPPRWCGNCGAKVVGE